MKKLFLYIIVPLVLLIFSACRKDINDKEINIVEDPPIVFVESSLRGKVVNEDGSPLANASVSVGNEMLLTDSNGSFHFKKVEVKKSGAIVKANIAGYFKGSSHTNFKADGGSYVEIKMLEKGLPEIIQSSEGGSFTNNQAMKVTISGGSIVTKNGVTYDGEVQVYSRWLDPTDEELGAIMPGDLTATDENGNPLALETYGMLVIELEDGSGSALEIDPNKEVLVEIPIPPSLLDEAPDVIPLWYFDLEEEQWLLKGDCQKTNSHYSCIINQTGYWNCDVPLPAICLSGQVFNNDSTFSAYLKVIVEDLINNFVYWGYTDSTGYFCGSVPGDAPLRLSIKDLCDSIVYTADIGPFSQDLDLVDIYLESVVSTFSINITGTVLHCMTTDVPSGHVAVRYPGKIRIYPFEFGGYDIDLALKCVEFPEMNIRVYSAFEPYVTTEVNHNDFSDIDLGLLQTCEDLPDYFNITVDSSDFWTAPTRWFLKNNTTTNWMTIEGLSGGSKFILDITDYIGIAQYDAGIYFKTENDIPSPGYPVLTSVSPAITLDITSEDGEYIEGQISGTAMDDNGITRTIVGDFSVRKAP